MKKIAFLLLSLFLSSATFAQIVTHSDGKIEIPNITSTDGPFGLGSLLWFSSGDGNTLIQENWGLNLVGDNLRPVKVYNASFLVGYTTGNQDYGMNNAYISGNVGIGTTNTHGYALAVNGSGIATSFYVKAYSSWPDYVFDAAYKRPTLAEVKSYIDQNHHLPDFPSAAEVEKNGINLGETDKLLTKKVEELTLYLIEKDQQLKDEKETNSKLQQEIDMQQEALKAQEDRITKLEEALQRLTSK